MMIAKWSVVGALALVVVVGLASAQTGVGGKKEDGKDAPRAKETEAHRAMAKLSLAEQLIDIGMASKSPASLLAAAEIMNSVKVENDPKLVKKEGGVEKVKSDLASRSPAALIAKAKEFAKGNDWAAAIAATERNIEEATQSPIWGIVNRYGHIHGGNVHFFTIPCQGHTHAYVHPFNANGPVDLDLYVFDSFGNLVAFDRRPASSAHVHWTGNGNFRIEVHMFSGDHTDYHLTVN